MGEVILTKLFITILLLAASVVAIVVVVWVCHLVADNWPYVVIAAVIVASILISAVVVGILDDRKNRRPKLHHNAGHDHAGHDPSGHDHAASLTPPEGHAR
jgi:archaellum component FlaG (FlaF/FlaG flagellin family)